MFVSPIPAHLFRELYRLMYLRSISNSATWEICFRHGCIHPVFRFVQLQPARGFVVVATKYLGKNILVCFCFFQIAIE